MFRILDIVFWISCVLWPLTKCGLLALVFYFITFVCVYWFKKARPYGWHIVEQFTMVQFHKAAHISHFRLYANKNKLSTTKKYTTHESRRVHFSVIVWPQLPNCELKFPISRFEKRPLLQRWLKTQDDKVCASLQRENCPWFKASWV